ncbi:MAG: hypothetical protein RML84_10715, partial [Anaerolineae bacterium]|nr:hypothetical protein [Anaerolineae bacterium]
MTSDTLVDFTVTLQRGDIVTGLEQNELCRILNISPASNRRVCVEAVTLQSNRTFTRLLSAVDLARLTKVSGAQRAYDGDAERFLLAAEAERIRTAYH